MNMILTDSDEHTRNSGQGFDEGEPQASSDLGFESEFPEDPPASPKVDNKSDSFATVIAQPGLSSTVIVQEGFSGAPSFDESVKHAMLNSERALEPGADFAGFTLLKKIGTGSFGVVFKAIKGNDIVALKILRATVENHEWAGRFIREAKVLSQLNHPNIVRVHDFGVEKKRPFIVLEYLEGGTLQDLIDAEKLPGREILRRLMAKVASGLTYCHSQGIVHRDLKPDNIMIEQRTGRPVLIDFGLVYKDDRQVENSELEGFTENLSIKDMIKGTPQFMAPEQAFSHDFGTVGTASDVWAFGALLYYLLTGQLLFPGDNALEILEMLGQGNVPKIQSQHPEMPGAFARIIQRCLQRESIHRPMMSELKNSLEGPAENFAVSSTEPAQTLETKTNRSWVFQSLLILLVVVVLLASIGAMIYFVYATN